MPYIRIIKYRLAYSKSYGRNPEPRIYFIDIYKINFHLLYNLYLFLDSGVVRILRSAVGLIGNDLVGSMIVCILQSQLDFVGASLDGRWSTSEGVLVGSSGNANLETDCIIIFERNRLNA
jgi:hypothetical protein